MRQPHEWLSTIPHHRPGDIGGSPRGDGAAIFEHACKLGLEGIVCKRIDLPYRPGPAKSWIKVKNKKHPALLRAKEAFELERQRYGK